MQVAMTAADASASSFAYLISGKRLATDSPGFAEAIAAAHAAHDRPRCLCLLEGVEMYVARLGDGFIVKRMPNTGSQHAPDCSSYEPPPEFSGLGQVLGSAITEDPSTGETTLKLGFTMSKISGRSTIPAPGTAADSVVSEGTKLSLRGLLHYLWDQAELTHWHPGFAGKRSWATVRRHLLQASENALARGNALRTRLYIPELFSVEQRDAINGRRMSQWASAIATPGKPQQLMLLIAEVKEIVPARYGYKAIIKHMPDQAFAIDEQLYRRLGRCFEAELSLWGATENLHLVAIATFGVSDAGIPSIAELSLMPTTQQWLPVEDAFDRQLTDRLVCDARSFVKGLRYNLPRLHPMAQATLTDTDPAAHMLFVMPPSISNEQSGQFLGGFARPDIGAPWLWRPQREVMPPLPARTSARCTETTTITTWQPSLRRSRSSTRR